MKVLFVLPNVQVGGVERVRLTLIEQLVADGIECELALRRCQGELMARARDLSPVFELAPKGIHQFVPALARLIRSEQPTHVVTAFSDVALLAWFAMRLARSRAKWVHSVHNTHAMVGSRAGAWGRVRYRLENRMGGFAYRHADAVVAVSEGVREEIIGWYKANPVRVTTIYNPAVPDDQLGQTRKKTGVGNPFRIVAVGRLVRQKGFDVLIRAMRNVPGAWRLDIWGDGPERPALQQQIAQLGLTDRIRLCGYTPDPFAVMLQADLFVMSSRHEGLPATLIEALACQCQVVSTNCPHGPSEILEKGALGQLVPVENPEALAKAVRRAMAGDAYVEPRRLLARARDFSRDACCARWEALLRSL